MSSEAAPDDRVQFAVEHRLVELRHHLARAEGPQVAAIAAGGA